MNTIATAQPTIFNNESLLDVSGERRGGRKAAPKAVRGQRSSLPVISRALSLIPPQAFWSLPSL